MREPQAGTTLGRCTFCKDFIIEGNGNRAKHATVQQGHWMCGDCVIGMKDIVFDALIDYTESANKQKENIVKSLTKYGWEVDDSGKLRKLVSAKPLNRAKTISKRRSE
tara:strand:+ start:302 stop:625 length:324 start_codon:yes stop_codon:yes gene_type:complete